MGLQLRMRVLEHLMSTWSGKLGLGGGGGNLISGSVDMMIEDGGRMDF